MIVRSKGKFCSIRQYLPKKPCKWGIKVWCIIDSSKKNVWDFKVYTGASIWNSLRAAKHGKARTGYEVFTIPRAMLGRKREIPTSPVHKAYTTWMFDVDVSDQLRGEYSCQVRSHKWWHCLFFFMIDRCQVNSRIIYKSYCKRARKQPLDHLELTMKLAKMVMADWGPHWGEYSKLNCRLGAHSLVKTKNRRVVDIVTQISWQIWRVQNVATWLFILNVVSKWHIFNSAGIISPQ